MLSEMDSTYPPYRCDISVSFSLAESTSVTVEFTHALVMTDSPERLVADCFSEETMSLLVLPESIPA